MRIKILQTALILVIPLISLTLCRLYLRLFARQRYEFTGIYGSKPVPGFIRHAIDTLPMGMLFFHTNGHVLLKNRVMDGLCNTLTGHVLINGKRFAEELPAREAGEHIPVTGTQDLFSVHTDNAVYSFRREELTVDGRTVVQLIAYDTMELFNKEAELKRSLAELEAKGKRLAEAAGHAEELARSEELLSAKSRIHDMVGQVLLSARYVLTEADAQMTAEQVLSQIGHVMEELLSGGEGVSRDTARARTVKNGLADAANAMGLALSFQGELPDESTRVMRLLTSGARVCMTNAVRHGMAQNMVIRFETDADAGTRVVFANDGIPPAEDAGEGGGLQSLRKQLTSVGGTMRFTRDGAELPAGCRFAVILEIPW